METTELEEASSQDDQARIAALADVAARVKANVERVIVGHGQAVDLVLVALLSDGHILVEDVPGIGKTTLAKAAARSLGCSFQRIQCTPDLLPSDVTGVNYFNQKLGEFEFRPGPVMAQIVLADEINRATPRTQSSLLEAMQERQVTVDGVTRPLPSPFLLIATQNPVELEGTFPLPEAQLDRFLLRLSLGYPSEEEEGALLLRFEREDPLGTLEAVVDAEELLRLQRVVRTVAVEETIREYVVRLCQATRESPGVELGASPRATMALYRAAQALAGTTGRDYVIPDDVKRLAVPVLAHRMILSSQSRLRGQTAQQVVEEVLETVPVPIEG